MAINFDQSALTELLQSERGLVGEDMTRRTLNVHAAAVQNCPVRSGRLRSSIRWTFGRDSQGLVGIIGTDVDYAIFVEEDTRPHTISPSSARVLMWPPDNFAANVQHPGTTGQHFLRNALKAGAT